MPMTVSSSSWRLRVLPCARLSAKHCTCMASAGPPGAPEAGITGISQTRKLRLGAVSSPPMVWVGGEGSGNMPQQFDHWAPVRCEVQLNPRTYGRALAPSVRVHCGQRRMDTSVLKSGQHLWGTRHAPRPGYHVEATPSSPLTTLRRSGSEGLFVPVVQTKTLRLRRWECPAP